MRDQILILLFVLFILVVFGSILTIAMAVWSECRADGNSFMYCLFLISGR